MERSEQIRIAKRLLAHIEARTAEAAPDQTYLPARAIWMKRC